MDAVAARDLIETLGRDIKTLRRKDLSLIHGPKNIGETDLFGFRHLDGDIPEGTKVKVVLFECPRATLDPCRDFSCTSGRSNNHPGPMFLESTHNRRVMISVPAAVGNVKRAITGVVHAVGQSRDGRLERETVPVHPPQESIGFLSAPSILTNGDLEIGNTRGQIGFHQPRIHFLFGNGVATNCKSIAFLQK